MTVNIGISGALGRMGVAVAAAVRATPGLTLVAVIDRPEMLDQPALGLTLTETVTSLDLCDVVIDFSTPGASVNLVRLAGAGKALVIGTTGFAAEQDAAIAQAAQRIPIVKTGNYSIGINVLAGIVEQTARRLGPEVWDIEIFEAHHRRKVDAPSGTALLLAQAAARGRGRNLDDLRTPLRDGVTGPRAEGSIGLSVMRGGGIIGEHSVIFASENETVTLSHTAQDRSLFAAGAAMAAGWIIGRPPGLYDMMDVLGLRG